MKDPIVEETRRIRDEHARRFGYNLAAICADIRCNQEEATCASVRVSPGTAEDHRNSQAPK